jgi:hypothetical protein
VSRRFGRNQKRKMRAQLQELELAVTASCNNYTQERNSHAHTKAKLQTALNGLNSIGNNFVEFSALLPPKELAAFNGMINHGQFFLPVIGPLAMPLDCSDAVYEIERRVAVLHAVEVFFERTDFDMMLHCELRLDDMRVSYAITDQALYNMPTDMVADFIVKPMRYRINDLLKERRRK